MKGCSAFDVKNAVVGIGIVSVEVSKSKFNLYRRHFLTAVIHAPTSTRTCVPISLLATSTRTTVVVVVFTLKTVLTSIQYPSLSYSSRQRNEFPWSHANPK